MNEQSTPTLSVEQQMLAHSLGVNINQSTQQPAQQVEAPQAPIQTEQQQVQAEPVAPVTEPVVQAPAQTQTPQIDYNSFLESEFGTTDTNLIKNRLSEYDKLQLKLQEIEQQPKYKTSVAEKLDTLLQGLDGNEQLKLIPEIARFMSLDENALEPKELVSFDMKLKYPHLSEGEITALINRKYGLSDLATEDEVLAGTAQLKIDALEAKKNIAELKHTTLNTPPSKAKADLAAIEFERSKQQINQLTESSLKKFQSISLKTDKVKDIADFVVDNKAVEKIKDNVAEAMVANNIQPTEENVIALAQNFYLLENLPHVINHIATQLQSKQLQTEIKEYHNADPRHTTVAQQTVTEQDVKNQIARMVGII